MKSAERNRLKDLLRDTITLLCKNGLTYKESFSIEALIGITLDDSHVFLVNINESVQTDFHALDQGNNEGLSDDDVSNSSLLQNDALSAGETITLPRKRQVQKANLDGSPSPKKKVRNNQIDKKHANSHVSDSSDEDLLFVKEEAGNSSYLETSSVCQNSRDSSCLQEFGHDSFKNHADSSAKLSSWTIPLTLDNQPSIRKHLSSSRLKVSNNLWSKPLNLASPGLNMTPGSVDSELIVQRPKKVFSCHIPECQQQFYTKRNLTGHLWKKHQIGEPTICKCGQVFAYKNKFYVHRKSCPDAQFSMTNGSIDSRIINEPVTNQDDSKAEEDGGLDFSESNVSVNAADQSIIEQTVFRITNSRSLNVKHGIGDEDSHYMNLETL